MLFSPENLDRSRGFQTRTPNRDTHGSVARAFRDKRSRVRWIAGQSTIGSLAVAGYETVSCHRSKTWLGAPSNELNGKNESDGKAGRAVEFLNHVPRLQ